MIIYTSYFANYRKYKGMLEISIARYSPKYFEGYSLINDKRFSDIVPSVELLNLYFDKKINRKEYAKKYIEQIKNVDFNEFYKCYNESILLCFEKFYEDKERYFCHRGVLSYYVNKLGYEMKEFN